MEMILHLDSDVFDVVKNGKKDVEVRVNDLKRRKLKIGDTLIFLKRPNDDEEIRAEVMKLDYYDTFNSLVNNYEMERLYLDKFSKDEWLNLMERFYTKDEQKLWGVVAITFKKCDFFFKMSAFALSFTKQNVLL